MRAIAEGSISTALGIDLYRSNAFLGTKGSKTTTATAKVAKVNTLRLEYQASKKSARARPRKPEREKVAITPTTQNSASARQEYRSQRLVSRKDRPTRIGIAMLRARANSFASISTPPTPWAWVWPPV